MGANLQATEGGSWITIQAENGASYSVASPKMRARNASRRDRAGPDESSAGPSLSARRNDKHRSSTAMIASSAQFDRRSTSTKGAVTLAWPRERCDAVTGRGGGADASRASVAHTS